MDVSGPSELASRFHFILPHVPHCSLSSLSTHMHLGVLSAFAHMISVAAANKHSRYTLSILTLTRCRIETSIIATAPEAPGEHSTSEAPHPSEMVNIDIAAEGDVILVLQQTRLRVSSAILSSASPVFKTMFGPNFLEGQGQRSAGDPREVTLHDDDLCAMTRLCRLLHHQPDQEAFPHGATHDEIVQCAEEFQTLTGT